ncbi:MAG: sigma-70 family RNA polymerase sigma factor [Pirellula sp.]|jgi:RNA polymerase sigma-70 factor (ECF subfamily)|nr:sigma-70 family RNA polymerase sigma factor [Pirellula sp.]
MQQWPETNESLILRVKDPSDAASWSDFLSIYRPVVVRMACGQGLQHADAEDLAQQVFLSVAKAIEDWEPDSRQPPFRVWLARITRNAIVNALTRRKPDAPGGSASVQEMLRELPERNDETTQQLMEESRREAIRWATEEIQCEFTEVTWAMFWLTSIEGESVAEVARRQKKTRGAVYMARFKVMQRLKEKVLEVSEVWSDVK